MSVSRGAVKDILYSPNAPVKPILQVLDVKVVGGEKYKLILTDGVQNTTAMLASQMRSLVTSNELKANSLIELNQYMAQPLPGSSAKVVVLMDIKVVGKLEYPLMAVDAATPTPAPTPAPSSVPAYGAVPAYGSVPSYGSIPSYGASAAATPPSSSGTSTFSSPPKPYAPNVPSQAGRGAIVRDEGTLPITPISMINPYSNRWVIKARVTRKHDIRRWSNAKGEGHLFNIDLMDSTKGEIRGTFFKEACDKFFPILEEGSVYTFTGGKIKVVTNPQYSTIKNNYEITFDVTSDIRPCAEDSAIATARYEFVKINSIASLDVNSNIDVLCIVKSVGDCQEIISTKMGGKVLHKRDVTVYDNSLTEVRLTLWGERAQDPATAGWTDQIVALKGVKVGEYQGKNLGTSSTTSITLNPAIPDAEDLFNWKQSLAPGTRISTLSSASSSAEGRAADPLERRKSVAQIKEEGPRSGEKGDFMTVKATITHIKHDTDPFYTACPAEGCNKKVTQLTSGMWRCEKCNAEYQQCKRRYVMSATISDHTGQQWISLFNDEAQKILGYAADELYTLKSESSEESYNSIFSQAQFKPFIFRAKVKMEQVNDEPRLKCIIQRADVVDFPVENKLLLEAILKYT